MMRITTGLQNNMLINSMQRNQASVAALQVQLASGKKLNYASENPSAVPGIMNATESLNKIETYIDNITYLTGEIEVADSTLGQITSCIQRVKTLTIQAANGTNGPEQLKSIGDEIKQIKEQLVSLGNTQYQNSYIFAGNKTGTQPFTINDDGSISYNGTLSDQDYQRIYSVADGVELSVNVPGDKVLGYSNLVSEGPPPEFEGEGILNTINNLTAQLYADNPDTDNIRSQIANLEDDQTRVLNARTEIGGIENRLLMTKDMHEDNKITYSAIQANLQDVDISEVVTKLSTEEVALQASMYAGSQVMSISLLNYM